MKSAGVPNRTSLLGQIRGLEYQTRDYKEWETQGQQGLDRSEVGMSEDHRV